MATIHCLWAELHRPALPELHRPALHDDSTVSSYHTSSSAATVTISNVSEQRRREAAQETALQANLAAKIKQFALRIGTKTQRVLHLSFLYGLPGNLTAEQFEQRIRGLLVGEFMQQANIESFMEDFPHVEDIPTRTAAIRQAWEELLTDGDVSVGVGSDSGYLSSDLSSGSARRREVASAPPAPLALPGGAFPPIPFAIAPAPAGGVPAVAAAAAHVPAERPAGGAPVIASAPQALLAAAAPAPAASSGGATVIAHDLARMEMNPSSDGAREGTNSQRDVEREGDVRGIHDDHGSLGASASSTAGRVSADSTQEDQENPSAGGHTRGSEGHPADDTKAEDEALQQQQDASGESMMTSGSSNNETGTEQQHQSAENCSNRKRKAAPKGTNNDDHHGNNKKPKRGL